MLIADRIERLQFQVLLLCLDDGVEEDCVLEGVFSFSSKKPNLSYLWIRFLVMVDCYGDLLLVLRDMMNWADCRLLLKTNKICLIRTMKVRFLLGKRLSLSLGYVMRSLEIAVIIYRSHFITVWALYSFNFLVIKLFVNLLLMHWHSKNTGCW